MRGSKESFPKNISIIDTVNVAQSPVDLSNPPKKTWRHAHARRYRSDSISEPTTGHCAYSALYEINYSTPNEYKFRFNKAFFRSSLEHRAVRNKRPSPIAGSSLAHCSIINNPCIVHGTFSSARASRSPRVYSPRYQTPWRTQRSRI